MWGRLRCCVGEVVFLGGVFRGIVWEVLVGEMRLKKEGGKLGVFE